MKGPPRTEAFLIMAMAIGLWGDPGMGPTGTGLAVARQAGGQSITPAQLQRAIHEFLVKEWEGKVSRVNVEVLAPREAVQVPAGRVGLRVEPLADVVRPGRAMFRVALTVNGQVVRKQKVSAMIEAYTRLVLTTRRIPRGHILNEQDVAVREWPIGVIEHGLVVAPDEAVGRRLVLTLSEGRPIPSPALESPDVTPERDPGHGKNQSEKLGEAEAEDEEPGRRSVPPGGGRFRIR